MKAIAKYPETEDWFECTLTKIKRGLYRATWIDGDEPCLVPKSSIRLIQPQALTQQDLVLAPYPGTVCWGSAKVKTLDHVSVRVRWDSGISGIVELAKVIKLE